MPWKYRQKEWLALSMQKRKQIYHPYSRKQFHRKYKAMAEELAASAIELGVSAMSMRRFVQLPIRHRRYYFSLVRNGIKKGGKK